MSCKDQKTVFASVTCKDPIIGPGGIIVRPIEEFMAELVSLGWKVMSAGGTHKRLVQAGIPSVDLSDQIRASIAHRINGSLTKRLLAAGISVDELTELFGGGSAAGHRVLTISRELALMLLMRELKQDYVELDCLGLPWVDMVICDFYRLVETIKKPESTYQDVIEATDIGGPLMVSAAGKGGRYVVCEPRHRELLLKALSDGRSEEVRLFLSAMAEAVVAQYRLDSAQFRSGGIVSGSVVIGKGDGQMPLEKFLEFDGEEAFALYSRWGTPRRPVCWKP